MSDTPRCPRCGSTNTGTSVDYKIKKGLGYAAEFGIGFLAGRYLGEAGVDLVEDISIADGVDKEWQCNDCGHIWRGIVNASHPSYAQLGTAKPQKYQKQQVYTAPEIQHKIYNKQDRAKLLKIIYKCDGRGGGWNDECACIKNAEHLRSELQKCSIDISKSKINSVNSYRRLADIILDSGWTRSKQKALGEPQDVAVSDNKKIQTIKIVNGFGDEIEVPVTEDPKGLRNLPFCMKVENCFHIEGRGDVVTGRIEKGYITIGDKVVFNNNPQNTAVVVGIELFHKLLNYAEFEDIVGLLLRENGQINKGDILTKVERSKQLQSSENFTQKIENTKLQTDETTTAVCYAMYLAQEEKTKLPADYTTEEKEYLEELKECLADGEIGGSERRLLNKWRIKLGISEERAAELEASLQKPQLTEEEQEYLEAYQDAMEDGAISEKERRLLDKLMKMNNISEERAKEIEMLNK